jgi:hypothetical protein
MSCTISYFNKRQVEGLLSDQLLYTAIPIVVSIGLALAIASLIAYRPNGSDVGQRRWLAAGVGIMGLLGYLAYLRFVVYCKIKPSMQSHFDPAFWQTSLIFTVLFIALTFFILPLVLPQTKIGTLYPFRRGR